jgi:hypothetical protein
MSYGENPDPHSSNIKPETIHKILEISSTKYEDPSFKEVFPEEKSRRLERKMSYGVNPESHNPTRVEALGQKVLNMPNSPDYTDPSFVTFGFDENVVLDVSIHRDGQDDSSEDSRSKFLGNFRGRNDSLTRRTSPSARDDEIEEYPVDNLEHDRLRSNFLRAFQSRNASLVPGSRKASLQRDDSVDDDDERMDKRKSMLGFYRSNEIHSARPRRKTVESSDSEGSRSRDDDDTMGKIKNKYVVYHNPNAITLRRNSRCLIDGADTTADITDNNYSPDVYVKNSVLEDSSRSNQYDDAKSAYFGNVADLKLTSEASKLRTTKPKLVVSTAQQLEISAYDPNVNLKTPVAVPNVLGHGMREQKAVTNEKMSAYEKILPTKGYTLTTTRESDNKKVIIHITHHTKIDTMVASKQRNAILDAEVVSPEVSSPPDMNSLSNEDICEQYNVTIPDVAYSELEKDEYYFDMINNEAIQFVNHSLGETLRKEYEARAPSPEQTHSLRDTKYIKVPASCLNDAFVERENDRPKFNDSKYNVSRQSVPGASIMTRPSDVGETVVGMTDDIKTSSQSQSVLEVNVASSELEYTTNTSNSNVHSVPAVIGVNRHSDVSESVVIVISDREVSLLYDDKQTEPLLERDFASDVSKHTLSTGHHNNQCEDQLEAVVSENQGVVREFNVTSVEEVSYKEISRAVCANSKVESSDDLEVIEGNNPIAAISLDERCIADVSVDIATAQQESSTESPSEVVANLSVEVKHNVESECLRETDAHPTHIADCVDLVSADYSESGNDWTSNDMVEKDDATNKRRPESPYYQADAGFAANNHANTEADRPSTLTDSGAMYEVDDQSDKNEFSSCFQIIPPPCEEQLVMIDDSSRNARSLDLVHHDTVVATCLEELEDIESMERLPRLPTDQAVPNQLDYDFSFESNLDNMRLARLYFLKVGDLFARPIDFEDDKPSDVRFPSFSTQSEDTTMTMSVVDDDVGIKEEDDTSSVMPRALRMRSERKGAPALAYDDLDTNLKNIRNTRIYVSSSCC